MKFVLALTLLLSSALGYSQDWTQNTFTETASEQVWVGLSSPHSSEKAALEEAYQEALNEAAKYNFGFNLKTVQNTYTTSKDHKVHQETEWSSKNIMFKGVKPLRQKVIKQENQFVAFREVSYSKVEIKQELLRLEKLTTTEVVTPKADSKVFTYGLLTLKSNQSGVQVKLQAQHSPEALNLSAPAQVPLATGVYFLFAEKAGMKSINKEVIVSGGENFINLDFEPSLGTMSVKLHPENSNFKINGKNYPAGNIDLAAGTYSIQVSHPDYFTKTEEVEILNGEGLYKEIRLAPKKMALSITSSPSDAAVFVNGNNIGSTPIVGYPLQEEGELSVVLVKKGFKMTQQRIPAQANRSLAPLNFSLEKK